MDADNLIRMANRIGDFFEAMPDHSEAVDGIATHIRKFWDPRMRRELLAALDADRAAQLKAIVAEALQTHRATLMPAHQ